MSEAGDTDHVPVYSLPKSERFEKVRETFVEKFGKQPDFYVRVPGRVNLIGEHIDYCGYGVCPMALDQDVFLAVSRENDKKLRLCNLDSKYQKFETDIENFDISGRPPSWHEYFLCGVRGIAEHLGDLRGLSVVVHGTVPPAAGLSSSSALVSAAALATAHANGLKLSKKKIAELCASCERLIGTQGGGMDQAIAFLAKEGCAMLIEFNPLRSTDVSLPQGASIVVAHSLAENNKAASGDFNCRVAECRLAAQVIAANTGLKWEDIKTLGILQKNLQINLEEMIGLLEDALHEQPYTKSEIVAILKTDAQSLDEHSLTPNTRHIESFKLKQRALHVYQEAARVFKFHQTCRSVSPDASPALASLGDLMNGSHDSLRILYECSHPDLDAMVKVARNEGGALGARLTGAGWGGCMVALVSQGGENRLREALQKGYYGPKGIRNGGEMWVWESKPRGGACIYE